MQEQDGEERLGRPGHVAQRMLDALVGLVGSYDGEEGRRGDDEHQPARQQAGPLRLVGLQDRAVEDVQCQRQQDQEHVGLGQVGAEVSTGGRDGGDRGSDGQTPGPAGQGRAVPRRR